MGRGENTKGRGVRWCTLLKGQLELGLLSVQGLGPRVGGEGARGRTAGGLAGMWPAVDTRDTREIEWAARTTRELTPDLYVVLITGRKTREYGRRSQAGENREQPHRHVGPTFLPFFI